MIIVSQNKKETTIFENITKLYISNEKWEDYYDLAPNIDEALKTLEKYAIRVKTKYQDYYDLGKYTTEERALEVLKEITERYDELKRKTAYAIGDRDYAFDTKFYYEMPLE